MSNEDILGKSNTKVYFVSVRDFRGGYDHFNFTFIFCNRANRNTQIDMELLFSNIIYIKNSHSNVIKNVMNG